jgi:ferric-dicitrate binding protein FerR (iron transport regulator)
MEAEQQLSHEEEANQLAGLLLKHLRQEINAQEQQELNKWVAEHPAHKQVFERINSEEQLLNDLQLLNRVNLEAWWQKISREALPVVLKKPFYKRRIFYALIVLLILTVLIIWYYYI